MGNAIDSAIKKATRKIISVFIPSPVKNFLKQAGHFAKSSSDIIVSLEEMANSAILEFPKYIKIFESIAHVIPHLFANGTSILAIGNNFLGQAIDDKNRQIILYSGIALLTAFFLKNNRVIRAFFRSA